VIFAVLDLPVAEVVLKRRFKLLSFFTIISLKNETERISLQNFVINVSLDKKVPIKFGFGKSYGS